MVNPLLIGKMTALEVQLFLCVWLLAEIWMHTDGEPSPVCNSTRNRFAAWLSAAYQN